MLSLVDKYSRRGILRRHFREASRVGPKRTAIREEAITGDPIARVLLVLVIVLLPLQDQITLFGDYSIIWLLFALIVTYSLLVRPHILDEVWRHPVFLSIYFFLAIGLLIEAVHGNTRYAELQRIFQMCAGAVCIASLCTDKKSLKAAAYAYVVMGVWLSATMFATSYQYLLSSSATDFSEASVVRADAFQRSPLRANLNSMSYFVAQASIISFLFGSSAKTKLRKIGFNGLSVIFAVATFLPISRSGAIMLFISFFFIIMLMEKGKKKPLLSIILLGLVLVFLLPQVVLPRMNVNLQTGADIDARALVYEAVIHHFPEYITFGVGEGNFWGDWGENSKFRIHRVPVGSHNCFAQAAIYWGVAGMASLCFVIFQLRKWHPKSCSFDPLALQLLAITLSSFVMVFFVHTIYAKEFTLAIGLLVAARRWVWPNGFVNTQ